MEIFARKVEKFWLESPPTHPKSIAINELQDRARLAFCKQEGTFLRQKKKKKKKVEFGTKKIFISLIN